jgi:hypothetical protein
MLRLAINAAIAGLIVATTAALARKNPGFAALTASLPVTSILAMLFVWHQNRNPAQVANLVQSTFWFILPSLPMFLLIPALLRAGFGFYASLGAGCGLTLGLYFTMLALAPLVGIAL